MTEQRSSVGDESGDAVDMVAAGNMPLSRYTLIHRGARLTDEESDVLVAALIEMGRGGDDSSGPGSGDDDG